MGGGGGNVSFLKRNICTKFKARSKPLNVCHFIEKLCMPTRRPRRKGPFLPLKNVTDIKPICNGIEVTTQKKSLKKASIMSIWEECVLNTAWSK